MFKWLASRTSGNRTTVESSEPAGPEAEESVQSDAKIALGKHTLFYEWATEMYGEVEGVKFLIAMQVAQRFNRLLYTDGNFADARKALLQIAKGLADEVDIPATPIDQPPNSMRYRAYLARWQTAYAVQGVRK